MTKLGGEPTDRTRRLRVARASAIAVALSVGAALLLGGCANSGVGLARAACVHVYESIHLYEEAGHAKSAAASRAKVDEATSELDRALQLAAQANSANPEFNPLMTTLQETGRTPESNLIPALRAQCEAAQTSTQSPVPGPTPGTAPAGAALG
ncbi:MAG: hypothetical protein ACRDXC_13125 [Acidimicrobiales bacterium]